MYVELVGIIIILKDGEKLLKAVKYVGPVGDENSSWGWFVDVPVDGPVMDDDSSWGLRCWIGCLQYFQVQD
jgi:hypothetical protein